MSSTRTQEIRNTTAAAAQAIACALPASTSSPTRNTPTAAKAISRQAWVRNPFKASLLTRVPWICGQVRHPAATPRCSEGFVMRFADRVEPTLSASTATCERATRSPPPDHGVVPPGSKGRTPAVTESRLPRGPVGVGRGRDGLRPLTPSWPGCLVPPARSHGDGTDGRDEHGHAAICRGRAGAPSARTAAIRAGVERPS